MILMNDFKGEPSQLRQQEEEAVHRVLNSGWFILGQEVETFEKSWARFCGANHAIGVGNGMDAIEISLRALNVGPGDEVITTSMTAMASVAAIVRAGATPVLADIDPTTAILDIASVERCITTRTKALLLVHLYGQVRSMEPWLSLCSHRGIQLVEDCAQAHGAAWDGKKVGTFGTFGAFSFYPTKNLGARGDGGAIITDSEDLAARARILRNYGQEQRYHHREFGLNSRLDEVQAAILSVRLQWLDRFNQRRSQVAAAFYKGVSNAAIECLAPPLATGSHVHHLFVVRCAERDRLAQFLNEHGIKSLSHYPLAIHQQRCGSHLRIDPAGLPNAEHHASQCLSIPCHPQLLDHEVEEMIKVLNAFK